jgi:chemotaxis protein CheC
MNNLDLDILKEIATIGTGNASSALSKMTNQRVEINVPNVDLLVIEKVSPLMGLADQVMTAIQVKILGDATGVIVLLLTPSEAQVLATAISHNSKSIAPLEEITNIIAGAALTSLANFLRMSFLQSIPASATDMLGAIGNEIVASLGEQLGKVLVLEVHIIMHEPAINGRLYLLFDSASSKKILTAAKNNSGYNNDE